LLGRDIKKTIIIDNMAENFMSTCPLNGIKIMDWYGDNLEDTELLKLIPFLKAIAINEEPDVRKVIKLYNNNYSRYCIDLNPFDKGDENKNPYLSSDIKNKLLSNDDQERLEKRLILD
jgi:hypothetical protein